MKKNNLGASKHNLPETSEDKKGNNHATKQHLFLETYVCEIAAITKNFDIFTFMR